MDAIVDFVRADDPEATHLLGRYVDELKVRLPGGRLGISKEWAAAEFGPPRGAVAVARLEAPVACGGLREIARGVFEIKKFYVVPRARRKGVARILLAALERRARDLGCRRVVLDTASPLEEAIRFYESAGYVRTQAFNDNVHASLWFDKRLPLDDEGLFAAFDHATLAEAEWNHRSHLRTALLHLERWGLDEAHLRMRAGIVLLNQAHGLKEAPARGYHETRTRFWLVAVASARAGLPSRAGADARAASAERPDGTESFLAAHPALLSRELPLAFYSRERLLSVEARAVFVPPDLAPLPPIS